MGETWGKLSDRLIHLAKSSGLPIAGQFELTSRCNLECRMCYLSKAHHDQAALRFERTAKEWIWLAKEARDAGMLYLLLTGGEVFLRTDFKVIYQAVSKLGLVTEIFTNGTLVIPEVADWLGQTPPFKVGVTLYGGSPETYKRVCGNAEAFDSALRGIDLLIAKGITVELRTTLIRENAGDFQKIAAIAEERGLELGVINYISPCREECGKFPEKERLSPQELVAYEKEIEEYLESRLVKAACQKADDPYLGDSPDAATDGSTEQPLGGPFSCLAGRCNFWITWNGRMTPCGLLNDPAAFPLEQGFTASWEELKKHAAAVGICTECIQCSYKDYCMSCPARLKNETGFFDKPAEYLCKLAQEEKKWRRP